MTRITRLSIRLTSLFGVALLAAAVARAQDEQAAQDVVVEAASNATQAKSNIELQALIENARQQWPLASQAEVDAARQAAKQGVNALEGYLQSYARNYADGWRRLLQLDSVNSMFASPTEFDEDALERTSRLFRGAKSLLGGGSDLPDLDALLARYLRATRAAESTAEEYDERLNAISLTLKTPTMIDLAPVARRELADHLGWLRRRGAAGELVAALDQRYSRPNVYLRSTGRPFSARVRTENSFQSPVNDTIFGTRYRGTSTTAASLDLQFSPNRQGISCEFLWRATITSTTTGYNGATTIQSGSTTQISAVKRVTLGAQGLGLQPATATANTTSTINGVSMRGLGRRAATDTAYQRKPATEREVERRSVAAAQAELDRRVDQLVKPARYSLIQRLRIPLMLRDQFPKIHNAQSTNRGFELALTQRGALQLAASDDLPTLAASEDAADLVLQLHTSAINNLATGLLAGVNLSEPDLEEQLSPLLGSVPSGLKTEDPAEVWSIEFAAVDPLTVEFKDDQLHVKIRAASFHVGDKQIPGSELFAVYTLGAAEARLIGTRQAGLQIVPLDYDAETSPRLGVRYQVFRSMLRKRFERVLPDVFQPTNLSLPTDWPRLGPLEILSYRANDGWLTVAYQLLPNG